MVTRTQEQSSARNNCIFDALSEKRLKANKVFKVQFETRGGIEKAIVLDLPGPVDVHAP